MLRASQSQRKPCIHKQPLKNIPRHHKQVLPVPEEMLGRLMLVCLLPGCLFSLVLFDLRLQLVDLVLGQYDASIEFLPFSPFCSSRKSQLRLYFWAAGIE